MTDEKNQYEVLKDAAVRFFKPVGSNIQQTEPSEPVKALQIEEVQQVVESALVHPFKTLEAMIKLLERQDTMLQTLIQDNLIKRQQHDDPATLGATLNYQLTYHRHLYVYLYSNTAFTLQVSNGATQVIPANYWSLVNYPAGLYLTVAGGSDTAPINCTFRSCDVPLTPAQQQVAIDTYTYFHIASNATFNVKTSAGKLHVVAVNNPGASWVINIYDNASGSGTVIGIENPFTTGTIEYDVQFVNGLTIITSGTTPGDITVAFK